MSKAMKIPDVNAAVEMGKSRENTSMAVDESQKQKKRCSMKQGKEAKPCASRHLRTSVISRNRRSWNRKIKNTKAELYSEVTLLKMIQALMQYSQSKITPARKQSKS